MDAENKKIEQEQEKVIVIEMWEKEKDGRISHKIIDIIDKEELT